MLINLVDPVSHGLCGIRRKMRNWSTQIPLELEILVKNYSQVISFAIYTGQEKSREVEVSHIKKVSQHRLFLV